MFKHVLAHGKNSAYKNYNHTYNRKMSWKAASLSFGGVRHLLQRTVPVPSPSTKA